MKLSDKILVVAEWLSSEDNELLALVDEDKLESLAISFVHAADILKEAASEVVDIEPEPVFDISPEKLEEMAAIATEFDASGDEVLVRQASVLDEILQTIATPKGYLFNLKKAEDAKIDVLKKKYKDVQEELDKEIGTKEAVEAIEKSPVYQERPRLYHPLSTRYCPDHFGASLARLNDYEWQCSLDHKIYNLGETGYTKLDGTKIPGGSVAQQTNFDTNSRTLFDTRGQRLGTEYI